MTFQFRMEQVLEYKHHQKEITHKEYIEQQERFEEIGYELYELLQKKETLQEQQLCRISNGDQMRVIQQYDQYIDQLEFQARTLQKKLQQARNEMDIVHDRLMSETIDVKKYEKLKEKQFQRYQHLLKQDESKLTDELSILRHTANEVR